MAKKTTLFIKDKDVAEFLASILEEEQATSTDGLPVEYRRLFERYADKDSGTFD